MALMCTRSLIKNARNHLAAANRFYVTKETPRPEDLATGVEKLELMAIQKGNEDPFRMRAVKRHASSKSNPNIVQSYYDCRMVGCVCEEDSSSIVWMWLFKGEPKRCQCGHWFKLEEYKPF